MAKSNATLARSEEKRGPEIAKLLTFIQGAAVSLPVAVSDPDRMPPIAPPVDPIEIESELDQLPAGQCLYSYRQFRVYYGYRDQLPVTVKEITRLREHTFRAFEEGSGREVDTDRFDAFYLHLFVWDMHARAIVGGYRLGQIDLLRESHGPDGIYLEMMFEFEELFYEGPPMLEIGRLHDVEQGHPPASPRGTPAGESDRHPHFLRRIDNAKEDAIVQRIFAVVAVVGFGRCRCIGHNVARQAQALRKTTPAIHPAPNAITIAMIP